ncbi:MAG: nucleotidyltransferase family protein [Proteobacteria bacterium]|nr:nucleotidyltransferase family protein [Pseudomonadota bacterium]
MTESEFLDVIRRNPVNRAILERLSRLGLPDCWLVSGALFQTAWNVRTGRDPLFGIKDYDLFYFDSDKSWDAEDRAIHVANALFADLGASIELRNQARVHLWYEMKFDTHYPPLARATDGIDRFLMQVAMVGVRPVSSGFEIYAPHALGDVANLIVRPNRMPNFKPNLYYEKAERWKTLWPELVVIPA